jgi:hypothetical protein
VGFAVVGLLFVNGAGYYRTPLLERAHHEGYWTWKAGGSLGHKLGVVGSSMMVLMLGYSLRKLVAALDAWERSTAGSTCTSSGLFGPLLVGTAIQGAGPVALSFGR